MTFSICWNYLEEAAEKYRPLSRADRRRQLSGSDLHSSGKAAELLGGNFFETVREFSLFAGRIWTNTSGNEGMSNINRELTLGLVHRRGHFSAVDRLPVQRILWK